MVGPSYPCHLGRATTSAVRTLAGRNASLTNIRAQLLPTASIGANQGPPSGSHQAAASSAYALPGPPRQSVQSRSFSSSSLRASSRRSHSDHNDSQSSRTAPSGTKRSSIPPDALELKADQLDATPTLDYLDSLQPKVKASASSRSAPRFGRKDQIARETRIYNKTRDAVASSFTRDQLATLAREAGLKGSYSTKVKKEEFVKRILTQRFQMEDPADRAERLRREERDKVNQFIRFEPAQFFLLARLGAAAVRNEAGKRSLDILTQPPVAQQGTSDGLGFWVRGKKLDTQSMQQWAEGFKQTILEKPAHVRLPSVGSDSSATPASLITPGLIRFVCQTSRCYVEPLPSSSDTVLDLRLQYVDESDAESAISMLRRYFSQARAASDRLSAAVYEDDVSMLRQYSLLPFSATQPLPRICQAQDAADMVTGNGALTFRASLVPDYDSMVAPLSTSTAEGDEEEPTRVKAWDQRGEKHMQEPFGSLLDVAAQASLGETDAARTFTATFGHILYRGSPPREPSTSIDAGETTGPEDAMGSPRPGLWPFAHLVDFLTKQRLHGEAQESGKRFVPGTLLRAQKSAQSSIWLRQLGWSSVGSSEELRIIAYTPEPAAAGQTGTTLEIEVATDGTVRNVGWRSAGEADLMMPEQPFDLRLAAQANRAVPVDTVSASSALQTFLDQAKADEQATPPSSIEFAARDGSDAVETLVLHSSTRVIRSRWNRVAEAGSEAELELGTETADATTEAAETAEEKADSEPTEVSSADTEQVELIHDMVGEDGEQGFREVMQVQWTRTESFPAWSAVRALIDPLMARQGSRTTRY